ncbi:uncharacterized protein LOC133532828 [Cydia pomonella]|uniref:uncharacterized protein LOC133532828 n=1 Tax=Cydia pomonella TaxID=82600 RepID=UPI002ADE4F1C|nr:uncharacterized protein LOC133532828 [Cydia pomonella]
MNRMKKHRIKEEKATTSSSSRRQEEHDLAYFIHDRVELMHQVFSVLKSKELKSLAPECVRRLSIDDLQELCLEELLGISSKRLCAILDGAEPPSDTDSSSQSAEQLETISLDSISSDDEILSQASGKKKKALTGTGVCDGFGLGAYISSNNIIGVQASNPWFDTTT